MPLPLAQSESWLNEHLLAWDCARMLAPFSAILNQNVPEWAHDQSAAFVVGMPVHSKAGFAIFAKQASRNNLYTRLCCTQVRVRCVHT